MQCAVCKSGFGFAFIEFNGIETHIELKYINAMAIAYAHKSHVIYLYYLLLLCLKNGMKIYEMRNDAWNWRLKYQNFLKFFTNISLFKYSFLAY